MTVGGADNLASAIRQTLDNTRTLSQAQREVATKIAQILEMLPFLPATIRDEAGHLRARLEMLGELFVPWVLSPDRVNPEIIFRAVGMIGNDDDFSSLRQALDRLQNDPDQFTIT